MLRQVSNRCPVGGERLSQAGFGMFQHLCVSVVSLCLLVCFVACFVRPLTALRDDLFEFEL